MMDEKQNLSVFSSNMMFEGFKVGGLGSEALVGAGQAFVVLIDDQVAMVLPGDAVMGCAILGVNYFKM